MLPLVGFLPLDDRRVPGTEQRRTFLLCTFWLVQALAQAGRSARARTVFERAAAFVNDVGLLAEKVDPNAGSSWAVSAKHSATSSASTRPGPSPRANSDTRPRSKMPLPRGFCRIGLRCDSGGHPVLGRSPTTDCPVCGSPRIRALMAAYGPYPTRRPRRESGSRTADLEDP